MEKEVFVSYASEDEKPAGEVCRVLEDNGIACWVAFRDVEEGKDYGEEIISGIRDCKILVLILSNHSNGKEHVKNEVERAVSYGRHLITLRMEDVLPAGSLELHLARTQWVNAFKGPFEDHLARLPEIVRNPRKTDPPPKPTIWDILRPHSRMIVGILCIFAFIAGTQILQRVLDPPTSPDLVVRPPGEPWLFRDSDKHELTYDDLKFLARVELFWARNELYARRGYKFYSPNGKAYAASLKEHYNGTVESDSQVFENMSHIEKGNVHFIRQFERLREFPFAVLHPGNFDFYWHEVFN